MTTTTAPITLFVVRWQNFTAAVGASPSRSPSPVDQELRRQTTSATQEPTPAVIESPSAAIDEGRSPAGGGSVGPGPGRPPPSQARVATAATATAIAVHLRGSGMREMVRRRSPRFETWCASLGCVSKCRARPRLDLAATRASTSRHTLGWRAWILCRPG